MKSREIGSSIIEVLISVSIIALASAAAGGAIFQILKNNERNTDLLTIARQLDNAGYWISNDAQMAVSITSANSSQQDFLLLTWTEWNGDLNPIYHSATYYFSDVSNGVGTLKRYYWSSEGANATTRIAEYIYYDLNDNDHSSRTDYQSPILNVKLTAIVDQLRQSKEYIIKQRPNY
jgi:type II secretory pathway component PulJ